MRINNRRYIGCKTKLLDDIYSSVIDLGYTSKNSFADLFAGTGVVGGYFASKGFHILLNDTLYSNYVIYQAFYGKEILNIDKLKAIIDEFNAIEGNELSDNYFSTIYGEKYYSKNDAKKIGYIRDTIENIKISLNFREYCYLVTSLLYASDKTANTVGHFESFLKTSAKDKGILMQMLQIDENVYPAEIYNLDANKLAKIINYDIVYIDPPYNARQYINFYHVLENLARWNKPTEFEGVSMKFKRNELKSGYCRNRAPELFEDLILSLKCKLIVVSYNNTYNAKSISSNNMISESQIFNILEKKGRVTRQAIDYSAFNTGKTKLNNHKEYLYICEVSE